MDWKRYRRLQTLRNNIEHYCPSVGADAIRAVFADSVIIVRDFLVTQLNEDPEAVLGQDTWRAMLEIPDVFKAEREACVDALEQIPWATGVLGEEVYNLSCRNCGSVLLVPDGDTTNVEDRRMKCKSCGEVEQWDTFVERALEGRAAHADYLSVVEGADPEIVQCPFCFQETYVIEEQRCAQCGQQATHVCAGCDNSIPPEEISDSDYCSWCERLQ